MEIDNVSETIIRLIFNELVSGKTINYVSDFLNTMRFSTPKEYKDTASIISEDNDLKSLWTEKMILNIARNIIYTGVTPLGKRKWVETDKGKRQIKQDNIEIVENTHEAIIDKAIFEKVQIIVGKGATAKDVNASTTTSLKGWIFCAHCGREMKKRTSKGYAYYRCSDSLVNGEVVKLVKVWQLRRVNLEKDWGMSGLIIK